MTDRPSTRRRRKAPPWRTLVGEHLPLETETALFILMSVGDVVMTYFILRRGGVEVNPVARWFIHGWGIKGMVAFKFGMVAFVCVLVQVIARRRLETARRLLLFATAIAACVVIYSLTILLKLQ